MKYEYFWETEYPFAEFLKKHFPTYRRKYSLEGNGIYDLVELNGKLYHIKYTSTKTMLTPDNHAMDADKKFIIETIMNNLKVESVTAGGKFITFPVGFWIGKVEIIKKLKEPK